MVPYKYVRRERERERKRERERERERKQQGQTLGLLGLLMIITNTRSNTRNKVKMIHTERSMGGDSKEQTFGVWFLTWFLIRQYRLINFLVASTTTQ